jgi:hypothetical protein
MSKIVFRIVDMKVSKPFSELAFTVEPLNKIYLDVDLTENLVEEHPSQEFTVNKEGIIEIFRQLYGRLTLERSEF